MSSKYYLEALTCCDEEFFKVIELCGLPFDPDAAVPLIVEKIVNPTVAKAFDHRVASVLAKTGKPPCIRWPMYHGTSPAAVDAILANGFDASKSRTAAFNFGSYFAENPSYSVNGYAQNDVYGHQCLFVCRVLEGRRCIGHTSGTTDTRQFESAGSPDGSIISTPFNDGVVPVYLLRWYRKFPTEWNGRK